MTVGEAKELVLGLIQRDVSTSKLPILVETSSPDASVPGKFLINRKIARTIHHFNGWFIPIQLSWFRGSYDQPTINQGSFFWYVFAIPTRGNRGAHYFICDFLQMRDWVIEFAAPQGRDHRNHKNWRADILVYRTPPNETQGYF